MLQGKVTTVEDRGVIEAVENTCFECFIENRKAFSVMIDRGVGKTAHYFLIAHGS